MKTLVRTLGLMTAASVLAAGIGFAADATPPPAGGKMPGKMAKGKMHKMGKVSKKGKKGKKGGKKGKMGAKMGAAKKM